MSRYVIAEYGEYVNAYMFDADDDRLHSTATRMHAGYCKYLHHPHAVRGNAYDAVGYAAYEDRLYHVFSDRSLKEIT